MVGDEYLQHFSQIIQLFSQSFVFRTASYVFYMGGTGIFSKYTVISQKIKFTWEKNPARLRAAVFQDLT